MTILYIILGIAIGSALMYLVFGVNILTMLLELIGEILCAVFSNWD